MENAGKVARINDELSFFMRNVCYIRVVGRGSNSALTLALSRGERGFCYTKFVVGMSISDLLRINEHNCETRSRLIYSA